jgi:DNA-binding transcriptional regulator/RsmH inhibitor MraZ
MQAGTPEPTPTPQIGIRIPVSQHVAVDKERRVRIPHNIASELPWIPRGKKGDPTIECIALYGPAGGIQIDHLTGEAAVRRETFLQQFSAIDALPSDAAEDWMHLVRFYAASWTISVVSDSTSKRFAIPAELLETGILGPGLPRSVVLFGARGILEMWGVNAWEEYQRAIAMRLNDLHHGSLRDLERRGGSV